MSTATRKLVTTLHGSPPEIRSTKYKITRNLKIPNPKRLRIDLV
jgi:hypothetical protein